MAQTIMTVLTWILNYLIVLPTIFIVKYAIGFTFYGMGIAGSYVGSRLTKLPLLKFDRDEMLIKKEEKRKLQEEKNNEKLEIKKKANEIRNSNKDEQQQ